MTNVAGNGGLHFVFKVAARCNLNCSYCYVYHKADDTWRHQPKFMPDNVFDAAVNRIRTHCQRSGQRTATVTFHGGEPCLAGPARFSRWCHRIREELKELAAVRLVVQTNGTLLDSSWARVFQEQNVGVGVSVDGPQALHDLERVDHRGLGSHGRVAQGIKALNTNRVPYSILSVIRPGADGLDVHRHLLSLHPGAIDYLLPDFTHDSIGSVRRRFGPTPCADYLIPVFDHWWASWPSGVKVRLFWNIATLVLGGNSQTDLFGNGPLGFVFVEPDGAIEGLDVLRVCRNGIAQTGLNVLTHEFSSIAEISSVHNAAIFTALPLPTGCQRCPESATCAGGYLPHRYSTGNGFDNPSVWCSDLLALFSHVRMRLDVPVAETILRHDILETLARDATARMAGGDRAP